MATNKQRREAERLRLQRQLEQRRAREASRKRATLIASVVGTLVVIAAVVVGIVAATGGSDKKAASAKPTPTSTSETADCSAAAKLAGAVSFQGVVVGNATNLTKEPKVCSQSANDPAKLEYKDLVVGKGTTAALSATVQVQYTGVLYKAGTQFDSTWAKGAQPATFSLQSTVPGFTQAIGGNAAARIPAMKVGGRRIVIVPSSLGYGEQGSSNIAPNTSLVFVIDLVGVNQ